MHGEPQVVHGAHGVGGGVDGHFDRILEIGANEVTHVAVERGREEHRLVATGATTQDPFDLRGETVVGHAVSLVENHDLHTRHVDLVGLEQVDETQRSGHHDLDALGHLVDLMMTTRAAVHRQHATARMSSHRFEHLGHLNGEFARRNENETEGTLGFGALGDARQHRHTEGEGLARSGLGATAHVAAQHGHRDGLFLDGERLRETGRRESGVDRVGNTEGGETSGRGHRRQSVDGGEGFGRVVCRLIGARRAATPTR